MTVKIKFTESGKKNYKLEDFKLMRRILMSVNAIGMSNCFISNFVDDLDEAREMKVGESLYFVPSYFECDTFRSMEAVTGYCNRFIAGEELSFLDEEARKNYKPDYSDIFCIKRTEKLFVVTFFKYEFYCE